MYDIAIIGGGLAGMTLLNALKPSIERGARVILIDSNQPPTQALASPSFDDRASAVSRTTLSLLDKFGLTDVAGTPMANIHISEQGQPASVHLAAKQLGGDLFGKVCANKSLGHALWQNRPKAADFRHQCSVQKITFDHQSAQLVLANEIIHSKLVVLADGGRSNLLQQLGIARHTHDYQQFAHVFSCQMQQAADQTAYERFTPQGALALLPLNQHFSGVLVSADPAPNLAFEVGQRFGHRLGAVRTVGTSQSYPLRLMQVREQVRSRLIVAGNSALSLHPVAGQGYNLVARSMQHIADHCAHHALDPGGLSGLLTLQANIIQDQQQTKVFSDGLARGFLGTNLRLPRQLGMGLFDQHPIAKQWFSQFAMGARHATL